VLGGDLTPLCPGEASEANMERGDDKPELIDAIGDVPVLVRVELGEARMAARDWASVGKGDVVALGRRVGESVVLRVGGVVVARGDLVEIDGEVGVRIVERLTGNGDAP
jgi:flagellar motor switch/type III secretory pathway protein FliN